MLPEEQGRFCTVCAKTVVDMSALTNLEILAEISKGKVCGQVKQMQLAQPFILETTARSYRIPHLHIAAGLMLLAGALTFVSCEGQASPLQHQGVAGKMAGVKNPKKSIPCAEKFNTSIKGIVYNQTSGMHLVGTKVTMYTLTEHFTTIADAKGNFELAIPPEKLSDKNVVVFDFEPVNAEDTSTYNYYSNRTEIYSRDQLTADLRIDFVEDERIMGMVTIYEPTADPVVMVKGKEVPYAEHRKALEGKKTSCGINTNDQYAFFEGLAAKDLFGKSCPAGLYIYQ